ncbi:hypothetical protein [Agromyces bauzanensis]
MVEVLHLAAVLPAGVGLCCAVGDRRGRARAAMPAAAMLAAMLAMAAGWPGVPPLAWSAVLLVLGVVGARGLRSSAGIRARHDRHMRLHRALGLVLGAALLLVTSAEHVQAGSGHSTHVSSGSLAVVTVAGAAGYLAYAAWIVARSRGGRASLLGVVEASAMSLMTALMAAAALLC